MFYLIAHKRWKGLFPIIAMVWIQCITVNWFPEFLGMDEICDNALDDDGDGLIDLNDPECRCEVIEPTSLIPNPSFEEMRCCPVGRSQMDCASGWIQASEPTTDYIHTCGWTGWDEFPPPAPFPDGVGIMGFRDGRVVPGVTVERNWKEYAGACLLSPLKKDVTYRFEFYLGFVDNFSSPPINITFFGTPDCQYLPFGKDDEAFGCPTNGPNWTRLGFVNGTALSNNSWQKLAIEVTPVEDIHAIAIGPPCEATQASANTYYFFDNLILADLRSFELTIKETTHPCNNDFLLEVPPEDDIRYQWYLEGVALPGESSATISQLYGEGKYEVRLVDETEGTCRVTLPYFYFIPEFITSQEEQICGGDAYLFGDEIILESGTYIDTFLSKDGCDSIVLLTLDVVDHFSDTFPVKIFEGTAFQVGSRQISTEGLHEIRLQSSLGCDSLVTIDLRYFNIYVPNVFSPNQDGRNDYFTIYGDEDLAEVSRLVIFDRWGTVIFEDRGGSGEQSVWNGTSQGTPVENGVYVFAADLTMRDGMEHQITGSITVIR